ncbi:MAG: 1-(5-phosphoribosyl)-5-[Oscillospiraceae bacterium]|nr:1-(5-phosphoribosyl)-5-[(5-phosphoribosylamino)methylideneamino]imidazole-4-carboxamide isomerase [Oscillospiraceae bacterium]
MKIFPAIDIIGGRVVRLLRGNYDRVERYEIAPEDAAREFERCGARYLHVVDLDGAKDGGLSNFDVISGVVRATGMFVEVGGGIRDEERIARYLAAGVGRVILGTAAVNDFPFLCRMLDKYGDRIAVGVDAKDGFVAINGWLDVTELSGPDFCRRVRDAGASSVIYTDISRDGAMSGTNLEIYRQLVTIEGLDIVASGGVSYLREIGELRGIGVSGAIVGKALYTGALSLREVIAAAGEQ